MLSLCFCAPSRLPSCMQPGERYAAAVARGLEEELGISSADASTAALVGPLAPVHRRHLDMPEIGVKDYEFVESWKLEGYTGPVRFNEHEVGRVFVVAWPPSCAPDLHVPSMVSVVQPSFPSLSRTCNRTACRSPRSSG